MRSATSMGTMLGVAAGLAVVTGMGCDGGSEVPTVAQIDQQMHTSLCRWEVKCGYMTDVGTCLAATHSPLGPQMVADLTAGRVVYDPVAGQKYLAAAEAFSCRTRDRHRVAEEQMILLARAAFGGAIPVGGTCFVDAECAGGTCDQPGVSGCPQGTCVALPSFLPPGARCGGAPDLCDGAYYCGPRSTPPESATCVPLPVAGEPCDDSFFGNGCAAGLVCDSFLPSQGTCSVPSDSGAACDPTRALCDDDRDFCDAGTGRCARLPPAGAACGTDFYCAATARCDSATKTCRPKGRLGEACQPPTPTDFELPCLGDLDCDPATLTCVLPAEPPACL